MPDISFRPVRDDDRAFLARLYASTRQEELAVTPWTEQEKAAFLHQQFEAQHTFYVEQFPDAAFCIVMKGAKPIGRLYTHDRADEIRLIDISILPAHCNRGYGSGLLRDLLTRARKERKPVRIHVEKSNPALRLYERLGFEAIEDRGVYLFLEWDPPREA